MCDRSSLFLFISKSKKPKTEGQVARALNFEFFFQGERAAAEQEYGAVEMQIRKMAEQVHEIEEIACCFGNVGA